MVEVLRTQDILPLASPSFDFDPDDWLARDADIERPVYLVVYPATSNSGTSADHPHTHTSAPAPARWSIAWPMSTGAASGAAWRHVQLEPYYDPLEASLDAQYAYFGAITKSAGPEIAAARGFALGTTRLAHRRAIERLARETPVPLAGAEEEKEEEQREEGTCQWGPHDWVRDLLARMAAAGIVARSVCEEVVAKAARGECLCSAVLDASHAVAIPA